MISMQLLHVCGSAWTPETTAAPTAKRSEARSQRSLDGGHGALDAMAMAAILVDRDRTVLHVNKAADIVLQRRDALLIHKGLLACTSGAALQQLAAAICAASHPALQPSAVLLERIGNAAPYQLSIAPVDGGDAALILFADPDSEDASLPARLRALFALTSAEAQLAVALARGESIAQIAARRGVLAGTVRFQIKSVAAKMRCSRQAEIAAIVAHLPKLAWKKP